MAAMYALHFIRCFKMQKYKKMTSVLYIDVFFVENVTAFLKKNHRTSVTLPCRMMSPVADFGVAETTQK